MSVVATYELPSTVGIRELRANLSGYVSAVKLGRSYTLTEHGKPVARLVPVPGASAYEKLVQDGVIQPSYNELSALEPPLQAQGTVSDLIGDQRR